MVAVNRQQNPSVVEPTMTYIEREKIDLLVGYMINAHILINLH